jgi:hypothetical protein
MTIRSVDVSSNPELRELAAEVLRTRDSWLIRDGSRELALVLPVDKRKRHRAAPSPERRSRARQAFLDAAGGWSVVDTDRLIADIYADRDASDRPIE